MSRYRRFLQPGPGARFGSRARLIAVIAAVVVLVGGITLGVSLASGSEKPPQATKVMILGDSVTMQTAGDYTWRYRLAQHLTLGGKNKIDFVGDNIAVWDPIAKAPSDAYVDAFFDRDHHAFWGDSIRAERDGIGGVLTRIPADVLVVALGANDLTYWSAPQAAVSDMLALINNARQVNPEIDIVVAQVLDRGNYAGGRDLAPQATAYNTLLDQQVGIWQTAESRVVVARTYSEWEPNQHTWDGSHPNPTGEFMIARAVANAMSQIGIGEPFGPLYGGMEWPGTGGAVMVTGEPGGHALTWPATPGATDYLIERKVISAGEAEFQRLPGKVAATAGANSWTTEPLPVGVIAEYRIVPVKGNMTGKPGKPGRATAR